MTHRYPLEPNRYSLELYKGFRKTGIYYSKVKQSFDRAYAYESTDRAEIRSLKKAVTWRAPKGYRVCVVWCTRHAPTPREQVTLLRKRIGKLRRNRIQRYHYQVGEDCFCTNRWPCDAARDMGTNESTMAYR